jgi:hypothetical protein
VISDSLLLVAPIMKTAPDFGILEGVKCGNLGQNDWSSIGHGEFAKREVGNYITKNTVIYCIYSKLRCFSNYLRNYQASPYYSHSLLKNKS